MNRGRRLVAARVALAATGVALVALWGASGALPNKWHREPAGADVGSYVARDGQAYDAPATARLDLILWQRGADALARCAELGGIPAQYGADTVCEHVPH